MTDAVDSALDSRDTLAAAGELAAPSRLGSLERALRRRLLALLDGLAGCELRLIDDAGEQRLGRPALDPRQTLRATLRIQHNAFWRAVAANGSVGAAESYMDGHWHCDDLVALVRILVRNRDRLDAMEGGLARLGGWAMRTWNAVRRNTRGGSRRNIAAHYDLGNAFFELFLDPQLMYSSALFASPDESLERAALRKLERICAKLALQPGMHVVELGSGWGGFAIHAARQHGCRVTTTTISREQHELATRRVAEAGLSDQVSVLLQDYRDLDGCYDRLVSIEMIEAIGHQYLDVYFAQCARLLRPDGMALIQAITIEGHRYRQALQTVDFIKRHIFPGSFIPSIAAMQQAAASTDLQLLNLEDIGPSYALTLRHWRRRFLERLDAVRALGYSDRFIRMWEFYLCYCEGGFLERSIGDVQMLYARPACRDAGWLPDLAPAPRG
jgi:cyclopropane-fatty-acyl-phospholipid synthase